MQAFETTTSPILLFTGDREKMAIVSQATAQKAAEINGKVEVVQLEGAGMAYRPTSNLILAWVGDPTHPVSLAEEVPSPHSPAE